MVMGFHEYTYQYQDREYIIRATRSMQGMFGPSVRELYLLDKLLINIEDSRSMCDHKKKYTCIHRNCESGLAIIYKHAAHRLVQHTLHLRSWRWHGQMIAL